ncbi:MAG: gamma-glutamyl-gamma-aminobutyrate hydrolase family protein, partial [Candidatus Nitrosocosmicus sp.]|nr:gamma-glutamyl-gamma-aminobutyrate hydrolase family protein [Candidatus Nitrosocosmicus sp.]
INSCNFARVNDVPFLGICFGFQLAIVEFARNVCKLSDANSTEINSKTNNPVVLYMPEQKQIKAMGGTMRLGLHNIQIGSGSIASKIYQKTMVQKRHRHRYEFNQEYMDLIERNGMKFTGSSDAGKRIEILEIPSHRFYLGIQYHGEFHSRPGFPEPAFENFVRTTLESKKATKSLA